MWYTEVCSNNNKFVTYCGKKKSNITIIWKLVYARPSLFKTHATMLQVKAVVTITGSDYRLFNVIIDYILFQILNVLNLKLFNISLFIITYNYYIHFQEYLLPFNKSALFVLHLCTV